MIQKKFVVNRIYNNLQLTLVSYSIHCLCIDDGNTLPQSNVCLFADNTDFYCDFYCKVATLLVNHADFADKKQHSH